MTEETRQDLDELIQEHGAWVARMVWRDKSDLEGLALCFSEIGEAYDEYVKADPAEFLVELADIVLRVADLMQDSARIPPSQAMESAVGVALPTTLNKMSLMLLQVSWMAKAVNEARHTIGRPLSAECCKELGVVLRLCFYLADLQGDDLLGAIRHKIQINATRGTRGRQI